MVSLDVVSKFSFGQSKSRMISIELLVIVFMITIWFWLQISTSNYFALLYKTFRTSIKLIFVFWVHFAYKLLALEVGMHSNLFF